MLQEIHKYQDYRSYLSDLFHSDLMPRGAKSKMAKKLGCQSSYLSQVVTERAHLSLEQAYRVAEYLDLTSSDFKTFMFLVQKSKAGTEELKNFYQQQIDQILSKKNIIKESIKVNDELNPVDMYKYYSAWWYAAIHIGSSLPYLNQINDFTEAFNLPLNTVKETLSFLKKCNLVEFKNNQYKIGRNRIHLGNNTSLVAIHHKNWRDKISQEMERYKKSNVHYSGVIGLAKKDALKVKKLIFELIKNSETILNESEKEEVLYTFNIDFYNLIQ